MTIPPCRTGYLNAMGMGGVTPEGGGRQRLLNDCVSNCTRRQGGDKKRWIVAGTGAFME